MTQNKQKRTIFTRSNAIKALAVAIGVTGSVIKLTAQNSKDRSMPIPEQDARQDLSTYPAFAAKLVATMNPEAGYVCHNCTNLRVNYNPELKNRDKIFFSFAGGRPTKEGLLMWQKIDPIGFKNYANGENPNMEAVSRASSIYNSSQVIIRKMVRFGGSCYYTGDPALPIADNKYEIANQMEAVKRMNANSFITGVTGFASVFEKEGYINVYMDKANLFGAHIIENKCVYQRRVFESQAHPGSFQISASSVMQQYRSIDKTMYEFRRGYGFKGYNLIKRRNRYWPKNYPSINADLRNGYNLEGGVGYYYQEQIQEQYDQALEDLYQDPVYYNPKGKKNVTKVRSKQQNKIYINTRKSQGR